MSILIAPPPNNKGLSKEEVINQLGNKMIKVIELFAGVGSQTTALNNIGVKHEVVGISEIDKFALKSYNAIHGDTPNFGDISKVFSLPKADLWTYSFPCQDISIAGKRKGLEKGTRSNLLYQVKRLLDISERPKYLLLENVKELVGKKFKASFDNWLETLSAMGYTNYWKVLNAKDYEIPQNRERVFCVSILGEHEPFEFPEEKELKIRLKDILEDEVDEKFYLSNKQINNFIKNGNGNCNPSGKGMNGNVNCKDISNTLTTNKGEGQKILVPTLDFVGGFGTNRIKDGKSLSRNFREGNRVYSSNGLSCCIKANGGNLGGASGLYQVEPKIIQKARGYNKGGAHKISPSITASSWQENNFLSYKFRIRRLTPKECWRLMGFRDEAFYKAEAVCSNSQLYKQAGNSIVVKVLESIFKNMFY